MTLRIERAPNLEQLPLRTCTFGIEGGKIGRAQNNEWFIPFEYLHSLHATVRFYNGLFFIEKRGTQRVAVNSPDRDLQTDEAYPIRDGDHLFLDELEVIAQIQAQRPTVPTPANLPPAKVPHPLSGDRTTPPRGGSLLQPDVKGDSDIDRFLKFEAARPAPVTRHESAGRQSVLHDVVHLTSDREPSIAKAQSASAEEGLDAKWYETHFKMPLAVAPQTTPAKLKAVSQPVFEPPKLTPAREEYQPVQPRIADDPGVSVLPDVGGEFGPFLQALGLNARELAPGEGQLLGRTLRAAIAGVVGVLQIRAEMRSRYHVSTSGRGRGVDSLLEASANVDDVLHRVFRQRMPNAPALDTAVAGALRDIQFHEFAVLDALRETCDRLVDHFDPEAIQERIDNSTGRARSMLGGKGRHWEAYSEFFKGASADRDDLFRKVCAPAFRAAYLKALEKYQNNAHAR